MEMCAFHKRSELYCELQCVYNVVVKSSRSLSHLLISFLLILAIIGSKMGIQKDSQRQPKMQLQHEENQNHQ